MGGDPLIEKWRGGFPRNIEGPSGVHCTCVRLLLLLLLYSTSPTGISLFWLELILTAVEAFFLQDFREKGKILPPADL
jgi:hypothetical protein